MDPTEAFTDVDVVLFVGAFPRKYLSSLLSYRRRKLTKSSRGRQKQEREREEKDMLLS